MRGGWIHGLALVLLAGMSYFWLRDGVRVPLGYDGDSFQYLAFLRNLLDGGGALHYPRLGAPFGASALDFPNADAGFHLLAWILTRTTSDLGLAFNIFFLLGFPACYLAAFWVLRRLGTGVVLAGAGAFAFTFLPYHFWRLPHLWLATYFIVPLVAWTCVHLWGQAAPARPREWLRSNKGPLAIAIATGTMGAYYAFFAAMLFGATGAMSAARARSVRPLVAGLALAAATSVVVILQLLPSMSYHARFGTNAAITAPRSAVHSQAYGLNLALLIAPHETHRIPVADRFGRAVRQGTAILNENALAYLGVVGVVGTLALLLHSLGASVPSARPGSTAALAFLSLVCILYATIGGFGYFFALIVTPEIRALNRISVILGFTGIAAFVLGAQALADRARRGALVGACIAVAIMALALVDQVPGNFPIQRAANVVRYPQDRAFVARIESMVPAGARILNLPYIEFPETTYETMRPFVSSTSTRWSFGSMRGRSAALWIQTLSALPPADLVAAASKSGFAGIHLDGRFYPDGGASLREAIAARVGRPWLESAAEKQYFIALDPSGDLPVELPIPPTFGGGFYGWEGAGDTRFSWCRGVGYLQFLNVTGRPKTVDAAFELQGLSPRTVHVSFNGAAATSYEVESVRGRPVVLHGLVLQPGENALRFHSDTPARPPGTEDPRPLSFIVRNPRLL